MGQMVSDEVTVSTVNQWRKAGLSEDIRRDEQEAAERLLSDSKVKCVIDFLKKNGVDDKKIERFLETLPNIIGDWEKIKDASVKKLSKRASTLSRKMFELARELDAYKKERPGHGLFNLFHASFTIHYSPLVTEKERQNLPKFPNLENLLIMGAKLLRAESDEKTMGDLLLRTRFRDRPINAGLKTYAVKQVSKGILNLIPGRTYPNGKIKKRSPNKQTAIIVTVLLDLEDSFAPNKVSQILRKTRNKNTS